MRKTCSTLNTTYKYLFRPLTVLTITGIIVFQTFCAQLTDNDKNKKEVTVSPAHLRFSVDPGKTARNKVTITNYTSVVQNFTIKYNDFDMTSEGKNYFIEAGQCKYSISQLVSYSPTYIEVQPGTSEVIIVSVQVPRTPEADKAAWGVLLIEQAVGKKELHPDGNPATFGVSPNYAFGVWLYQNPGNLEISNVSITKFTYQKNKKNRRFLMLDIENNGDGISYCKAYVDMTNLETGKQNKLGGKNYTVLPGYFRTFIFELPDDFPNGTYSAIGVIGYDSNDKIVAADLEIKID